MNDKFTPKHIAVAGNIGAGKTTLVRKLADHYQWEPHLEAVDHNPYLEDFYYDMSKWAFPLQIYFLNSRFNQVLSIRQSQHSIIQDRTIYEDAYIFAKNLMESKYLDRRDYETYLSLFQSMKQMIQPPDLLIYLRANIPKLIEQISRRGREYESTISIKYLEDLNRNYEDWIAQYQEGNLLIIDVNHLDYVNRPDDFLEVSRQIENKLIAVAAG
ncbi:MAG: deoxynucleoside kinase [Bacteroidota bacterium]